MAFSQNLWVFQGWRLVPICTCNLNNSLPSQRIRKRIMTLSSLEQDIMASSQPTTWQNTVQKLLCLREGIQWEEQQSLKRSFQVLSFQERPILQVFSDPTLLVNLNSKTMVLSFCSEIRTLSRRTQTEKDICFWDQITILPNGPKKMLILSPSMRNILAGC